MLFFSTWFQYVGQLKKFLVSICKLYIFFKSFWLCSKSTKSSKTSCQATTSQCSHTYSVQKPYSGLDSAITGDPIIADNFEMSIETEEINQSELNQDGITGGQWDIQGLVDISSIPLSILSAHTVYMVQPDPSDDTSLRTFRDLTDNLAKKSIALVSWIILTILFVILTFINYLF